MNTIIFAAVLILAVTDLILYLRVRREQNGFRPDLTEEAVAQLSEHIVYRKGKDGNDDQRKRTQIAYRFQVGDVTYQTECTLVDHFRPIPASTKVVYQRKNPQMAYLPEFEKPDVKGMSAVHLSGAILFFLLAVLFVIIGL